MGFLLSLNTEEKKSCTELPVSPEYPKDQQPVSCYPPYLMGVKGTECAQSVSPLHHTVILTHITPGRSFGPLTKKDLEVVGCTQRREQSS